MSFLLWLMEMGEVVPVSLLIVLLTIALGLVSEVKVILSILVALECMTEEPQTFLYVTLLLGGLRHYLGT
jgi:hypothetical protein